MNIQSWGMNIEDIGLEKVSFHSNPKDRQCKGCSNYCTVALNSHTSKAVLKILQARLQQYVNQELPDVQGGFRKGRGTRSNCQHLLDHQKNKRVPEEHLLLLYWLRQTFVWITANWKILQEMGIPDHLICLLRNLYASQEATVRTGQGTKVGSKLGKVYVKAVYCHPAYLTYIRHAKCWAGWSACWNQDCQ